MATPAESWQSPAMSKSMWIASLALLGLACESKTDGPSPTTKGQAQAPAAHPATAPVAGGEPITGTLQLDASVDPSSIKPTDILFIMARKSTGGDQPGPLVAVKKLDKPDFPARFEIGAGNVMMKGVPFQGPFVVYARLDRDGDPMTKKADDLYAKVEEPVPNGASNLSLVLKRGHGPASAPSSAPTSKPAH